MGTWSPHIYDNDTALEFMWNVVHKTVKMAENNNEYLVVAEMFIKYGAVDEVGKIIEKLTEVIKEELSNDVINEWKEDCREPRKILLNDMLKKIEDIKNDSKEGLELERKFENKYN